MKNTIILIITISLMLSGCVLSGQQSAVNTNGGEPASNGSSPKVEPQINSKLDFSNQNLEKIPENVFKQTNLEELNVSNNKLTGAIQAEIRHLQNLKVLNLSNNLMTGVPAEIGQLQKLEILDLSNNQLTGLPYELGNLKNLKTLYIFGNNYSELDLSIIEQNLPSTVEIIK
ncbi:MAG: leucine-rich repeat domain-containing protein [Patescibacteria group bacterium]